MLMSDQSNWITKIISVRFAFEPVWWFGLCNCTNSISGLAKALANGKVCRQLACQMSAFQRPPQARLNEHEKMSSVVVNVENWQPVAIAGGCRRTVTIYIRLHLWLLAGSVAKGVGAEITPIARKATSAMAFIMILPFKRAQAKTNEGYYSAIKSTTFIPLFPWLTSNEKWALQCQR